MVRKKSYFHEVCFYKDSETTRSFKKIITFLMKDVSAEKAFRMFNIDPSFVIDFAKDLDTVDYEIDVSKYKDAKYLLVQISKRAAMKIENYSFKLENSTYCNDVDLLESYEFDGYTLKVVKD